MATTEFFGEAHSGFQQWRQDHPDGFFLNCKSGQWMLHRVDCKHPGSPDWEGEDSSTLTRTRKICSTQPFELPKHGLIHGKEMGRCKDCKPLEDIADSLIAFATELDGSTLTTSTERAPFLLKVVASGLQVTPRSTKEARTVPRAKIQAACEAYFRFGWTRPADYPDISFHNSYILTLIDLIAETRRAYLFLWNPDQDKTSFANYERVLQNVKAGRSYHVNWVCPSRRPRIGDIAYVQRTGRLNNGIFARGRVVSEPDLRDDDGIRGVDLDLSEFLPLGHEIPRQLVIDTAEFGSRWGPQASGTLIPVTLQHALETLWEAPEDVASDLAEPPGRIACEIQRIIRDTKAAREMKVVYDHKCQVCGGQFPTYEGKFYIEVHHLKPLGGDHMGLDEKDNMLVLCPNHHALFDLGIPAFDGESAVVIYGKRHELILRHKLNLGNVKHYSEKLCRTKR